PLDHVPLRALITAHKLHARSVRASYQRKCLGPITPEIFDTTPRPPKKADCPADPGSAGQLRLLLRSTDATQSRHPEGDQGNVGRRALTPSALWHRGDGGSNEWLGHRVRRPIRFHDRALRGFTR